MTPKEVSRRGFFKRTAAAAGAAGAALSMEERHLLAFLQAQDEPPGQGEGRSRRAAEPTIQDIPGPVPTLKLGGIEVSRLIAGHNIMMGQAHEGGSGLLYVSALVRNYFTEEKVMETLALYEEHGINCSGARMADNMAAYMKKYMAQGGNLDWMAGISSEQNIPMAIDTGCKLGYVHGNMADRAIQAEDGVDQIATLLDQMKKAGMASGVCCHSLDVVIALEEAGVKHDFYVKTVNPTAYRMPGGRITRNNDFLDEAAAQDQITATVDVMRRVEVPFIGFKVLSAGRVMPSDAFRWCFEHGCDALLVGMYDFQVAHNANLTKQVLQEQDRLNRSRPWCES